MIPLSFVAGVVTYIWPFVTTTGGFIAIAIVYGSVSAHFGIERVANCTLVVYYRASSGVFAGLMASPAIRMGSMHDVGSRVGISMTIVALGAVVGPPASGAINAATGTFTFTGIYAGVPHYESPAFDSLDALCQELLS